MTTAVQAARANWKRIAECEHRFVVDPDVLWDYRLGPNPADLCEHCGATRELGAKIQRHLRG